MRFTGALTAAMLMAVATLTGCGGESPAPTKDGPGTNPPARTNGQSSTPLATPGSAATPPAAMSATAKTPAKPAPNTTFTRSTLSGVYTAEEATAGQEMYVLLCASCHTAVTHTGPEFRKKWAGRPLAELYTYMRTLMPKNEPGSLTDEDYGVLLAYMLQMNKMPAGTTYLSTDSSALAKIKIDTVKTVRKKTRSLPLPLTSP